MAEIREKRHYYETHLDEVKDILKTGSDKARTEAEKTLAKVRELVKMY